MIIYTNIRGPRLRYIGDHICNCIFGQPAVYTEDASYYRNAEGIKINYSFEKLGDNEVHIVPSGLLGEKGIRNVDAAFRSRDGRKILFANETETGFDIFSAAFYLLSRYEEYLEKKADKFGRYDHLDSIAFRKGFLDQPLVDHWIRELATDLKQKFPGDNKMFLPNENLFRFIPTYDIDEAWSFRHKSMQVTIGGMVKDLLKGRFARIKDRQRVRSGRQADPFDSFHVMDEIHQRYNLDPLYFFLVAAKRSRFDRNISPRQQSFQRLVKSHALKYRIGLHPSWQSVDPNVLHLEKKTIEDISGKKVNASRQHFIRFSLPKTYRMLLHEGISEDFSMGYGGTNGFRASTSIPFFWYDLEKEETTELKLFPFCFMDANCFFEQNLSPVEAEQEMRRYYDSVRAIGGTFISIWHNTFLGTDPLFRGWREAYQNFLNGIS